MQENNINSNNNFNGNNNFNSNNNQFYKQQGNEVINNENSNESYYNQQNTDNTNNLDYNIVDTKFENQNIKKFFSRLLLSITKNFIRGMLLFGLMFLIFAPLSGISKGSYFLVLLICFGFPLLVIVLSIINYVKNVRNDVQQNGFSIFGKTTKDKIKSISIICVVIFYLIMFLLGKFGR